MKRVESSVPLLSVAEMDALEDVLFCEISRKKHLELLPVLRGAWVKLCGVQERDLFVSRRGSLQAARLADVDREIVDVRRSLELCGDSRSRVELRAALLSLENRRRFILSVGNGKLSSCAGKPFVKRIS